MRTINYTRNVRCWKEAHLYILEYKMPDTSLRINTVKYDSSMARQITTRGHVSIVHRNLCTEWIQYATYVLSEFNNMTHKWIQIVEESSTRFCSIERSRPPDVTVHLRLDQTKLIFFVSSNRNCKTAHCIWLTLTM